MSAVVTENLKDTPITRRHLLTPARLGCEDTFRMVTYNTLAGGFTSDPYAHEQLFPYCDRAALGIEYRQGRLMQEVLGYNADIINLQEVGTETFHGYFSPALRDKGYHGLYTPKPGTVREGGREGGGEREGEGGREGQKGGREWRELYNFLFIDSRG